MTSEEHLQLEPLELKIQAIARCFQECIGQPISRYEVVELLLDDGTWHLWNDMPIRLYFGDDENPVSVVWQQFDWLWIEKSSGLPYPHEMTIRWVENSIADINRIVGSCLKAVWIGDDEMTFTESIKIWIRVVLELESGWFEIFNALDENGYKFHLTKPEGKLIQCL